MSNGDLFFGLKRKGSEGSTVTCGLNELQGSAPLPSKGESVSIVTHDGMWTAVGSARLWMRRLGLLLVVITSAREASATSAPTSSASLRRGEGGGAKSAPLTQKDASASTLPPPNRSPPYKSANKTQPPPSPYSEIIHRATQEGGASRTGHTTELSESKAETIVLSTLMSFAVVILCFGGCAFLYLRRYNRKIGFRYLTQHHHHHWLDSEPIPPPKVPRGDQGPCRAESFGMHPRDLSAAFASFEEKSEQLSEWDKSDNQELDVRTPLRSEAVRSSVEIRTPLRSSGDWIIGNLVGSNGVEDYLKSPRRLS